MKSGHDQHLSAGQQGRHLALARGGESAGGRPVSGRRVVQLSAVQIRQGAEIVETRNGEHLAIGQQSRVVNRASLG